MKARERLHKGLFNTMNVECLPDGSQVITLHSEDDRKVAKFRVKNLYQKDEKEIPLNES